MAEPAPRPWKDLPCDILTKIARHLPCLVDRLSMSRTCHDWWFAVQWPSPPRQLPWLLLSDPTTAALPLLRGPGSTRRISFYCVPDGDIHNLRIGHDTGGARFFGSYDGGWLLLSHGQTSRHTLLNLHTDRRLFLPDYVYCVPIVGGDVGNPVRITILAATFSSPPRPNAQCFGAAIIDSPCGIRCPQLAFWSMEGAGDHRPVAMGFMENFCEPWSRPEDVIHHKGAFHVLNNVEHLLVYEILKSQEGIRRVHHYYFMQEAPHGSSMGMGVFARYLVESRGELLMVVRYARDAPGRWDVLQTRGFQVYQATQHLTGAGQVQLAWTELPSLDGRMLFVARGCSRSYEVADFPGFGFGDGIYFLDDWNCNDASSLEMASTSWMLTFGIMKQEEEPTRWYNCSDNGMCQWVEGEPRRQVFRRWFTDKEQSNNSPPIWFLP